METPAPGAALRASLRSLLDENDLADALAWYYVFFHPPARTQLFVHAPETKPGQPGPAQGFLVRAQTGLDLFRPLVTYRARDEQTAVKLFQAGLPARRPVYLTVPAGLANWANRHLVVTEAEQHRLYRLPAARRRREINVLVQTGRGPDGAPRCEIRSGDRPAAAAGVNWQSARYAEIFVYTDPAARGRGWGRSVVSALASLLLDSGRLPLYVVAESNQASVHLAESAGFEDTGLREFVAQAVWPGE